MPKIRKDDEVMVIAGKDRGKRGMVSRVFPGGLLLVEGVNMVKKHIKPNPHRGVSSDIVSKEMPIQVSNVALYNPVTGRGGSVGFKFLDDGRKVRYFKSTGEVVDV
uniref:Large ribosomal subunit protein uL24 n=1 Tax=Candidatus Kentrum sp. MB TaxID=2138164 RepID=A0A450XSI5_9GAMM|nr:MAG: LSU ribosomal protein L24P [Candidatus Kentron sp. MB]VFK32247.1 MAG: LSU ribosomal protein L24P [Candidatus Kentron sp. MB]VFK75771.1 MAG: LSU ribosomal protein L24P [Candidatus Kentron sp. MB]